MRGFKEMTRSPEKRIRSYIIHPDATQGVVQNPHTCWLTACHVASLDPYPGKAFDHQQGLMVMIPSDHNYVLTASLQVNGEAPLEYTVDRGGEYATFSIGPTVELIFDEQALARLEGMVMAARQEMRAAAEIADQDD